MINVLIFAAFAALVIALAALAFFHKITKDELTWFTDSNKQLLAENDALHKAAKLNFDHREEIRHWETGMMEVIGTDGLGGVKEAIQAHKNVIRRVYLDASKLSLKEGAALYDEMNRINNYLGEFVRYDAKRVKENANPEYFMKGRQL